MWTPAQAGRRIALIAIASLAVPAGAGAQSTQWTQLESGTTQTITAIEYQGEDRFWFTTAGGRIYRRIFGAFQVEQTAGDVAFRDIEFQAGGQTGLAVGDGGTVWRSTDAGDTWSQVDAGTIPVSNAACSGTTSLGDVTKVAFANDSVVYLFGPGRQIARSTNGGATWQNANGSCRYNRDQGLSGAFFVPGSDPISGYFAAGAPANSIWFTGDNFGSTLTQRPAGLSGTETMPRLAGDATTPLRQWVTREAGLDLTTDGWATKQPWTIANPTGSDPQPEDVATAGGRVLTAGLGGAILLSSNGQDFTHVPAQGALAATNWRAVDLASATHGAVGGDGGVIATASPAPVVDTVPPTGTITGPATGAVNTDLLFSASVADNGGGSGIDANGFAWTVPGFSTITSPNVVLRFITAGTRTIKVTFKDREGNVGEAIKTVTITAPAAAPAPATTDPGRRTVVLRRSGLTFAVTLPSRCVVAGKRIRVAIKGRKLPRTRKIKRVVFQIDKKAARRKTDSRSPFSQLLSTTKLKAGKHDLNMTVTVTGLRKPLKLTTRFKIC